LSEGWRKLLYSRHSFILASRDDLPLWENRAPSSLQPDK